MNLAKMGFPEICGKQAPVCATTTGNSPETGFMNMETSVFVITLSARRGRQKFHLVDAL